MTHAYLSHISSQLDQIVADGIMKTEREITSPQGGQVSVGPRSVINLCANNYLGLADHPDLIAAAKASMEPRGFGMASVRFICGTQDLHHVLEARLDRILERHELDSRVHFFQDEISKRSGPIDPEASSPAMRRSTNYPSRP